MNRNRFINQFCECGKPAVIRSANAMACQRCADLTSEGDAPKTAGIPDRGPRHCGWVSIREACNGFLANAGLSTKFQ
jgi:hypothetical protein